MCFSASKGNRISERAQIDPWFKKHPAVKAEDKAAFEKAKYCLHDGTDES